MNLFCEKIRTSYQMIFILIFIIFINKEAWSTQYRFRKTKNSLW